MQLDLNRRLFVDIDRPVREFRAQLGLTGPLGEPLRTINLRGRVRSRLTLSEPELHFGESCVRSGEARTRSVTVTCHEPGITPRAVVVGDTLATCRLTPFGTDRYRLSVTPSTSLPPGDYAGELIVFAVGADGEARHGARIPLTFRLLPSPPSVPSTPAEGTK